MVIKQASKVISCRPWRIEISRF